MRQVSPLEKGLNFMTAVLLQIDRQRKAECDRPNIRRGMTLEQVLGLPVVVVIADLVEKANPLSEVVKGFHSLRGAS